jgi:hypothetical protein
MRYAVYLYDDSSLIVCHLVPSIEEGEALLRRLVEDEGNRLGVERAHTRIWYDNDRLGDVVTAYEVRETYRVVRVWAAD